jgi:DNA-directed RNA polymerase specialized sigma24 family protein
VASSHHPQGEFAGDSCREPPSESEIEWVERARLGDERAWEELFTEHYARVYRFFRARVADAEQAEELAVSVFLQAFRSIDRFDRHGQPFAEWLFGIARHELASHYRALRPTVEPVFERDDGRALKEFLEVEMRDMLEFWPCRTARRWSSDS